ncbi:MAG: hypothetical protein ABR549_03315 [Mycobacteriales bacterium]
MSQPDRSRWTPIRVDVTKDDAVVDWCMTPGASFTEPFFDDTIALFLRRPFNQLFRQQTSLDDLDPALPALPLTGLVCHVSRCGSTLVSQALAAGGEVLSLSEPRALDAVSRADLRRQVDDETQQRWVGAIYRALAQASLPEHSRAAVKLDAWTLHRFGLVKRVFPRTPWVLLIRDPVEILVSQLRRRGAHMVPGALPPELLGVDPGLPAEEYCARVLGGLYEAALAELDEHVLVLDHAQLLNGGLECALQHLGVDVPDLSGVRGRHAKQPAQPFRPDAQEKQREATAEVCAAVELHARAGYEALRARTADTVQC